MFLQDIFDSLTYGELSHLYIGGEEANGIEVCDYPKIVSSVNLGLIELYKRFPLKTGEVRVIMHDEIQRYYLDPQFARSNDESREPIKYIADSQYQPFKGGVNKIEIVYDEDGKTMYLNDNTRVGSLFTPEYNCLQVPFPDRENSYTIHYRASHDKILIPGLDAKTQEIRLPPGYIEALLFYIGARMFTPMGSEKQEGNVYTTKFEQSCAKITDLNLMNDDNTTNDKLDRAGWL